MNYQIFINQKEFISGDLLILFLILIVILGFVIYASKIIIKKLRANETLKYEFVTIIAHKFRTPLTQIKWILETMLPTEQDQYKKENLENIGKSAETLIGLTNTLVEITDSASKALSSYNLEKANICEFVNKVANRLTERFHEKNLFFGIQCSVNEIFVKLDQARMDFVLQTLIENAINYSPPGRNVEIYVAIEKNKAIVNITDHGIGIDQKDLPQIFTKFFRAKNAQVMDTEGFGVGLYLTREIVKRHRGKIEVYSDGIGKGTTFIISLPLV